MKRTASESINDELFELAQPHLESLVGAGTQTLVSTLGLTGAASNPDFIYDVGVDFSLDDIK